MKVEGTYSSVTKGVSQQAPADRLEGQMGEQVNMLSDPIRGTVRRNGMILQSQQVAGFDSEPGDALTDSFSYRAFPFRDQGLDYDVLYRSRPRVGSDTDAHLPLMVAYNKTPGQEGFIPVVRDPSDGAAGDTWEVQGLSAITSIGSYILMAANNLVAQYGTDEGVDNPAWAGSAAAWVRGGTYSRTFRIRAKRRSTGVTYDVSHTTPSSTYPGVLDTNVLRPDRGHPGWIMNSPFYSYWVSRYQEEYESQVTAWTIAAAGGITPAAIAVNLKDKLTAAGWPGWGVAYNHLVNEDVEWIEVDDGGDGSLFRAVLTNVESPDQLTDLHRVGKVVRVQPRGAESEAYYLKAEPKEAGDGSAWQQVLWREAAGVEQYVGYSLAMGTIRNGVLYWASQPFRLQDLLAANGITAEVPDWARSTAGDLESMPPPAFFRKPITMLTTFQDRLLIGSGSVVNASEKGDYLNFYRTTMLTLPASDPTEFTAAGTETDTLRTAVQYDRNLMMQGDKFHYALSGKTPLDASNPQMSVQFALENAAYAQPVGVGKYVYLLKEDTQLAASRLLQVQAGVYQDSPDVNDVSKQLRDYINGTPAEMVAMSSPGAVIVRTEHFLKSAGAFPRARPWGLYVFQYMDNDEGQRAQESWNAWEWSTALGTPIGLSANPSGDSILLYTVAFGAGPDGQRARALMVLKGSMRTDPTGLPYLDALTPAAQAESTGMFTPQAVEAVREVVYTAAGAAYSYDPVPVINDESRFTGLQHPHYTVADAPPEGVDPFRWTGVQGWASDYATTYPGAPSDNLWTGVAFPAYVDLTNPFVRDKEGKAKLDGRLNLTSLQVTTTRTAGLKSSWIDYDGVAQMADWREEYSRIRYNHLVWVGREVKDVQVRLSAVDWLPLTINAIAWKGNWFKY